MSGTTGAVPKAMVLAAGRGSRLRPLTDELPKPLVAVGGRPLIDWRLDALAAAGVRDVVINVAYRGQQIIDHVGDGSRWGLQVRISDEGEQALETGGGIAHALPLLGAAPVVLCNADAFCDLPLDGLVARAGSLDTSLDAHLVLVRNPPEHPGGDFALADGWVSNSSQPRLTYSGLAVIRPAIVAGQPDAAFPLAPLLRTAMAQGRVSGERFDGFWCDVGTPQRLQVTQAHVSAGLAQASRR